MAIDSKGEILEILRLPEAEFRAGVMERARPDPPGAQRRRADRFRHAGV